MQYTDYYKTLGVARDASAEVRELARVLRERPSSLVRESKEQGVEIGK